MLATSHSRRKWRGTCRVSVVGKFDELKKKKASRIRRCRRDSRQHRSTKRLSSTAPKYNLSWLAVIQIADGESRYERLCSHRLRLKCWFWVNVNASAVCMMALQHQTV